MQESAPQPFENTKPLRDQNNFLFSYVLLREEQDGILGFLKVISAHDTPKECLDRSASLDVVKTNIGKPLKWGYCGEWEVIRRPETDTEKTIDIVKVENENEDFYGEPLIRDKMKNNKKMSDLKDRASIDQFKENKRELEAQKKAIELRKIAMDELQAEVDDPNSLTSYAQLHWKRLTQKSQIKELMDKLTEGRKALRKTIKQIQERDTLQPEFVSQWENEIRRVQKLMAPKQASNNPVDKPICNLGSDDDLELATDKNDDFVVDPYDNGIGLEDKTEEDKPKLSKKERDASFLPENLK